MANGETLREIKELVAREGDIKVKSAMRLSLEIQVQAYEKLADLEKRQNVLEERVKTVESNSIMMWAQRHPKIAIAFVLGYLFVSTALDVRQVLAFALGIELP